MNNQIETVVKQLRRYSFESKMAACQYYSLQCMDLFGTRLNNKLKCLIMIRFLMNIYQVLKHYLVKKVYRLISFL